MPSLDRPFRPVDLAATPLASFDLDDLVARLVQEPQYRQDDRAALTLVHDAQLSIVLVALRAGGEFREHHAPASAMVTLVRGRATLLSEGDATPTEVTPGTLVAFAAGLDHSLVAEEDSACLLVIGGRAAGG